MPDRYGYNTGNGMIPVVNPGDAALPKEELSHLREAEREYTRARKQLDAVRDALEVTGRPDPGDRYMVGYFDALQSIREALAT